MIAQRDQATTASPTPKIMYYCHDTYGLGHLRRTLTLANHLRRSRGQVSQLIVTGSPMASSFPCPDGADFVKLPSVVKTGAGQYEARSIAAEFDDVRAMRRDILLSAARHFQPDVFVVDHAPAGMKGEAVATLRYLKEQAPQTKLAIGLRDVIDEAPRVREAWIKEGAYQLFDDVYDLILVYGQRELNDVVAEYGLSPRAAAKTRFVGHLGREPGERSPAEIRASLPMETDRLVVVTAGGGEDGKALFRSALLALRDCPQQDRFDCLLVGGPLMAESDRAELTELAGGRTSVHVLDFTPDMTSYIGAADAVVSMGGYNTVCEILSLGSPAIIVPRVSPRKEQLIRAEALSKRGLVRMIHPDELTPGRLAHDLCGLLASPENARPRLAMNGLIGFEREIGRFLPKARVPEFEFLPAFDPIHAALPDAAAFA